MKFRSLSIPVVTVLGHRRCTPRLLSANPRVCMGNPTTYGGEQAYGFERSAQYQKELRKMKIDSRQLFLGQNA